MSEQFRSWMRDIQQDCEAALAQFLPAASTLPQHLHAAMRYAALDGGKRIRPLLVHAAGQLFNAPQDALRRAAAAVEMIHVYSLVHDDMPCMDDDALRRGKPTVHIVYDEATALLVGDALQAQAFLVLAEGAGSAAGKLEMVRILAQAAGSVGMCGGQAIDLASVGLALTREQLEQMHKLKTGALLRAAVLLGAGSGKLLAAVELSALDAYSAAIGLAFQVVDDILDASADSVTLGKTAGKDAADNKPTYVSLLGLSASRLLAQQLCEQAHTALQIFGAPAHHLHDLADLIVQRQA
ncbi:MULTISPECIES: farnesyl diphosphate synthase [unclassified Undibacterium]|uniref:polyprenyl synthetase family protein n=1 Tax=unclassified Undibacterium TaxID=2630295 RepID=UPI002AC8DD53|nr:MULTISPECIES: farnesyl diphosphate synthase [unclassified Undibacterium]MEB0138671.1 polyprenyl synthetase family protein [Undibacterium sp. CCC2.1]MEB0171472.1 polyprenyl synthetase family protein [Undibacterium sp. CCC1.1]MEB0177986.1 polyprenyl synthetase family protein [Undibacterium sp. CCC3.4]MEB0214369.1 polyprenyl synthetase family protein [Undibacterium sp. 5I2]WPX44239.1 polyprenyl synthetase family protein [Undibacterium sp. CCC3.4]